MKHSLRNGYWKFISIASLAAILLTLGVLQYRWIGELSEGERERQQRNLAVSAENLTREFDREITRALLQLQIDPVGYAEKKSGGYALRYKQWRATALYPKMADKIYVVGKNERGEIQLSVYSEQTQNFEETEWTPKLAAWRSRIEEDLKNQENAVGLSKSPFADSAISDALIMPVATVNLGAIDFEKSNQNQTTRGENSARQIVRRVGYTIVLLNADYIKNELLPALVARYFNASGDGGADGFDVFIRNRQTPSQIVYQSVERNGEIPGESDVERDFFSVRLNEIENLIPAAAAVQTFNQSTPKNLNVGSPEEAAKKSVVVSGIINLSNAADSSNKINLPAADSMTGGFQPRWQLLVRRQNGSLEIAAEKMRWRNLLISAGILLLLGANGVLLIVLSNRAFNFARRQRNFVASVSHELRTPLAVIRSLSENLADGIVKNDEQMKQYGTLINDEERRLSVMVEQMLGFAAAQEDSLQQQTNFSPQNVSKILDSALEDNRADLQKSDFQVEKIIEPDLPPILADFDALRRAFGNVVSNAVKYSGEQRRLIITARAIRRQHSSAVEISFEDRGGGISASDLPHVFKLFYRGQMPTMAQIKGSGIGLSLVKQIVEAHAGSVAVRSEIRRGSVFIITLPAQTADENSFTN